jgi:hypothetical protein
MSAGHLFALPQRGQLFRQLNEIGDLLGAPFKWLLLFAVEVSALRSGTREYQASNPTKERYHAFALLL